MERRPRGHVEGRGVAIPTSRTTTIRLWPHEVPSKARSWQVSL